MLRIVGNDDGGKLMSPAEFEAYKAKMGPQRAANRLFVSWTNPAGMDCTLPGPQTLCFCQHRSPHCPLATSFSQARHGSRYIQHKTDYETVPKERPVPTPCREKGCKCKVASAPGCSGLG